MDLQEILDFFLQLRVRRWQQKATVTATPLYEAENLTISRSWKRGFTAKEDLADCIKGRCSTDLPWELEWVEQLSDC